MLSHFHILVADDDEQLLDAVGDALVRLGAEVVRAPSGAGLIEQLANAGPFDLVVTDIGMPWMSGMQAMQLTRAAGLATPVIVMTALTGDHIPAQVRALGRDAVLLQKPFDLRDLEDATARLLSARNPVRRRQEGT